MDGMANRTGDGDADSGSNSDDAAEEVGGEPAYEVAAILDHGLFELGSAKRLVIGKPQPNPGAELIFRARAGWVALHADAAG
jgi:hypothetical protein